MMDTYDKNQKELQKNDLSIPTPLKPILPRPHSTGQKSQTDHAIEEFSPYFFSSNGDMENASNAKRNDNVESCNFRIGSRWNSTTGMAASRDRGRPAYTCGEAQKNEEFLPNASHCNNNYTKKSQYGPQISRGHAYDLNLPPEETTAALGSQTTSQIAPVTPEKSIRVECRKGAPKHCCSADKRANHESNENDNGIAPSAADMIIFQSDRELQNLSNNTSFSAVCTVTEDYQSLNNEGNHLSSLTRTPEQKPRRKKHRPKVITEGKPRPRKPVTPKQSPCTESPAGKRNAQRKPGNKISTAPEELIAGLTDTNTLQPAKKSCGKSLNFGIEGQTGDGGPKYKLDSIENSRTQAYNVSGRNQSKLTVALGNGIEVVMENTLTGIAHDLTNAVKQMLLDYSSLPEENIFPAKTWPPWKEWNHSQDSHAKEDKITTQGAKKNNEQIMLQTDNQLPPVNPNGANCSTSTALTREAQANGTRNKLFKFIEQPCTSTTNLTGVLYNTLPQYQAASWFPDIIKKKRTGKAQNAASSCMNTAKNIAIDIMCPNTTEDPSASIGNCLLSATHSNSEGSQGVHVETDGLGYKKQALGFAQKERSTKKRSRAPARTRDLASLTNITSGATPPSYAATQAPVDSSAQQAEDWNRSHACVEALVAEMRGTLTTKKRTKKSALVNSAFSSKKMEQSNGKIILYNQSRFSSGSLGTPQEVVRNQMPSADELAEHLQHLDVNRESSNFAYTEQNALVPYGGEQQNGLVLYRSDATITPFADSFIKKHHPRPKVDLDEETNKVWKLLIANINNEGVDGTDEDKAKMWEEERNVFRGRANSFIARMHLVQGDRRFSQWKGSVVDSVVGVFLTQNVSDHLSSSAFMSLAARFPLKPQKPCYEERIGSDIDKPIMRMPNLDNTIKWNEEISHQSICDQSSMTLHDCELDEEKEVVYINDFSTSSVVSSSRQEVFYESVENRSTTNIDKILDIIDIGEKTRATNDAVSSQNSVDSPTAQTVDREEQFPENNSEAGEVIDGFKSDSLNCCKSFVELLRQVEANKHHEVCSNGNGIVLTDKNSKNDFDNTQTVENDFHVQKTYDAYTQRSIQVPNPPCNSYSVHFSSNSGNVFQLVTRESRCYNISNKTRSRSMNAEESASQITTENMKVQALTSPTANHPSCTKIEEYKHENIQSQTQEFNIDSKKPPQEQSDNMQQQLYLPKTFEGTQDTMESSSTFDNLAKDLQKTTGSNIIEYEFSETKELDAMDTATRKAKSRRVGKDIRDDVDWDALRKQAKADGRKGERTPNTMDSLDWEAVRCADVNEIANTIKERGMSNVLAGRIKNFLNRLVREHGSIDLEWLRHVPPDKAKEYLLSIRGLGLKSVECVRLLTLHHLAFPVDTNVGRIAVRLGWVPLQPLPESLQLHLLELYPVLESIQKYLWPRLCKLDQRTLYELHYQMITFGKVFCTKNKPNCNACPMRGECRHFASAFASARLALPGPEEKGHVNAIENRTNEPNQSMVVGQPLLPLPQATEQSEENQLSTRNQQSEARYGVGSCEPIVEEPPSPEPERTQVMEIDMEDTFCEDANEIPTIKLNIEEFTQNLQNYMQNNMELQEGDLSKALVALTAEAASIPVPKLKNVSQLRTEHQVYELPDNHPLLQGLDRREPDDPCSYLLAIWTPGEMADSIQPPERSCNSQDCGKLCDEKTCFTCNSTREADSQIVRGTLLIPCRTAMRGSFPLNGTYFQVNEVFADHDSSLNPIHVPRSWIWNLPRRTVYFGTSIPTIFKGLTTEDIQHCFWRGFVCVRGFDQKTRAPRPLMARLHFPASKLNKRKRNDSNE